MRRARGFVVALTFALTAAGFPSFARAEPVSQLHPTNYVNDFAHVLSSSTEAGLNQLCQQIDEKAHAQLAVVTINSLDGNDIESYAVDLFKQWGIGNKSTNRGVLILLAVKDHRYRTEVGYGLEPILPDGKVGGFGREAVPFLKQGDYDAAMRLMTQRVAEVIAEDAGVQITGTHLPSRQRPPPISLPAIALLILIAIVVFATPLRGLLFWWLLVGSGPRWGGGSGGGGDWGGGGFGGSGGGFGGFGGGTSGGGGASGSW